MPHVSASLDVMARNAKIMWGDGLTVFARVKEGKVHSHYTLT
jgi:hypothetical protein